MNPSPTDPAAVQEFMRPLGFELTELSKGPEMIYCNNEGRYIPVEVAAFFYNVVQQQRVAARIDTLNVVFGIMTTENPDKALEILQGWRNELVNRSKKSQEKTA